jgi:multicomponent Na+:H+ antiporter subunit C
VTLLFALTVGIVFGCGAYLLRASDLVRVIVGLVLVSNAASLALMAAGLRRGQPPILPFASEEPVSDPLVQAMTLTALVIGLALVALLLVLALRIHDARGTIDLADLRHEEQQEDEDAERAREEGEAT